MGKLVKHQHGNPRVIPGYLSPIFTPSLDDSTENNDEDQLILKGVYGTGLSKDDTEVLTHVHTKVPSSISSFKDCLDNFYKLIRALFTADSEFSLAMKATSKFVANHKGDLVNAQKRAQETGLS